MDKDNAPPDVGDTTAEEFWGARASEYNEYIRRVVPRYEEQQDRLFDYLPPNATRVLELGCGTGNVSLRLATRYPHAHFTFVDGAPEMLRLTAARLRAHAPGSANRAQFLDTRFEELAFAAAAFDLIVASLSLHHVRDVAFVYPRLASALATGGSFVMLDGIRGVTADTHARHMARWAEYWTEMLSPEEAEEAKQHVELHDHYRSITEHFELLRQAGFSDMDCVWRDGLFTLLTARKR